MNYQFNKDDCDILRSMLQDKLRLSNNLLNGKLSNEDYMRHYKIKLFCERFLFALKEDDKNAS